MKYYIGIDLGTTNSAICSYDGTNVRVWKSTDGYDVTPSSIYIDKRGNRFYGLRAYNQAPYNPKNSATLFKRFMGTSLKKYINKSKLFVASAMLSSSDYTIEDIVERLDFNTASNFINLFKAEFGVTPGKYRKAHQKGDE